MRRIEFYFRETAAGIRRNGIMAFAAMSTAFIALFLFGLALIIAREINLVIEAVTGNVQVAVYLSDPVKTDTVTRIQSELQQLPAVASVEYENKDEACARAKQLFESNPAITENVPCDVYPASFRVTLADTAQYAQITAALSCEPDPSTHDITCTEPGVLKVLDFRDILDRLSAITRVLRNGVLFIAVIMLVSATVLVANTLRMGMFARRKEIGIMRLVGATNWRIRVPFLIEGLVEALVGAALAIITLFLVKVFVVDQLRGRIVWLPLIRNGDVLAITPWILIAAAGVAIVAGTIGIRRFLDV
ncbi:MAG TPA: permease-like cell division protein FtsX [Actinomycetota bacterium]|nr:permease-like cell division protein FtsX [Actinomycetota bacterium]